MIFYKQYKKVYQLSYIRITEKVLYHAEGPM